MSKPRTKDATEKWIVRSLIYLAALIGECVCKELVVGCDHGSITDAELHEPILAGDHEAVLEGTREWLRAHGFAEPQIAAVLDDRCG